MKLKVLTILLLIANNSYSQKIILDEDFKDNKNKWQIELIDLKERANISSGRYDLYTLDKENWHYFTISKEFNDKNDFGIETTITKLPREKTYQKINTDNARQLLTTTNYTNKSNKLISEGLKIIESQQSLGVRYNLDIQGKYEWYYSNVTLTKKEQEELSHAIGFVKEKNQQILYSDELYGITWGSDSNNNLFSFNILPEFKTFNVVSLINGTWTNIIDYTTSDKILSGNATNKLSVVKIDDYLNFYINDTNVGKAPFQQFYGTNIGLFVGPETHISVDNFKIITNEPNNNVISATNNSTSSYKSSGTGFLISDKGYFVTNNHVIDDASEVWIETNLTGKKETLKAKVVLVDKNNDLAILKLDNLTNLPSPTFGFKPQTMDVGTTVFAMGYPLLSYLGDELKITDGIVSSKTGYKGDISSYQISAPIQPGNSGGALFDKKGYLVGITNAGIPDAQNVGYAIKASYLQNLIELLPEKVDLQLSNKIENLSFTDQIKELTKFVVIVKVK